MRKNECVADSATGLVAHNLGASQAQMGPQETGQTQGGWNLPITYCKGIRINMGLCTMAIYGVSRLGVQN